MILSIFTATYNRAYCLTRLFESLKKQEAMNFEWIIVDDNSTDNTDEIVDNYINSNPPFSITYMKNVLDGGKHRAINMAIPYAAGQLFMAVDSDDFLTEDATLLIEEEWKKNTKDVLGLCFRRINPQTGQIIGNSFKGKYASPITINYVWNLTCDKAEILRTDIISNNLFPEYPGERFCTEGLWIIKMSKNEPSEMICCDQGIRYTEYLDDGLTKNIKSIKKKNPCGYLMYYKMLLLIPQFYLHPKQVLYALIQLLLLPIFIMKQNKERKSKNI